MAGSWAPGRKVCRSSWCTRARHMAPDAVHATQLKHATLISPQDTPKRPEDSFRVCARTMLGCHCSGRINSRPSPHARRPLTATGPLRLLPTVMCCGVAQSGFAAVTYYSALYWQNSLRPLHLWLMPPTGRLIKIKMPSKGPVGASQPRSASDRSTHHQFIIHAVCSQSNFLQI